MFLTACTLPSPRLMKSHWSAAGHATSTEAKVPGPSEVDGAVDDDAVKPGSERPAAVESVERAHGRQERLLGDAFGRGAVVRHEIGRAPRPGPVHPEKPLDRLFGSSLRFADQLCVLAAGRRRVSRGRPRSDASR